MFKYQLDSLDGLDEGARAFYEEKDGKFQLKVEGIPQGEDVSGLKAKIDELPGDLSRALDALEKDSLMQDTLESTDDRAAVEDAVSRLAP